MPTITEPTTTRHRLTGTVPIGESVRALLFGTLADLAWPIVDHYRSDLYHDARWIDAHVAGPYVFYFGADSHGTAIGTDRELVGISRRTVWRVRLVAHYDRYATTGITGRPLAGADRPAVWFADVTPIAH